MEGSTFHCKLFEDVLIKFHVILIAWHLTARSVCILNWTLFQWSTSKYLCNPGTMFLLNTGSLHLPFCLFWETSSVSTQHTAGQNPANPVFRYWLIWTGWKYWKYDIRTRGHLTSGFAVYKFVCVFVCGGAGAKTTLLQFCLYCL